MFRYFFLGQRKRRLRQQFQYLYCFYNVGDIIFFVFVVKHTSVILSGAQAKCQFYIVSNGVFEKFSEKHLTAKILNIKTFLHKKFYETVKLSIIGF